ncbi:MAG: site-specific integrase, partial [Acidobacteriota bacterium]
AVRGNEPGDVPAGIAEGLMGLLGMRFATPTLDAAPIRQRLAAGDLGLLTTAPSPLFETYARAWLAGGEGTRKASTQRFYTFNLNLHILPVLGAKPVASLKRADCRELMTGCKAKGLQPASMRGVNRTLSAVLSQAVEDGWLPANPAFRMGKHLRDGDTVREEIDPFTREDAYVFLEYVQTASPVYYPFFLCALRTGMRLGELLALEWDDLDFAGRLIHIRRARVAGKLTSTKNKQRRRVDMSLTLATVLKRLRTDRKRLALAAGEPMAPTVFLTPEELPLDGDNLRSRVFYRLIEQATVKRIRLHDLRHTYASLLIQNGESLAYVRDQLGHSSIQVTVDIYGHCVPGANRAAVDRLDAAPIRIPGASDEESAASGDGSK